MHIEGLLLLLLSVQADKQLVKDVLTHRPLENSLYKSRHPDDTDDPDSVGVSSEDKAEGMEDILGVSRRLNKPSWTEPLLPELAVPEKEGMIRVPKKDLKRAQGILKDILAGRKVRLSTGETQEDVPFQIPKGQAGDASCELCHQSFESTHSLYRYMKTHTGDTRWSCDWSGKVLASKVMYELHMKGCSQEKGHWCQECNKDYTTKQALVAHLKVKHGPAPTVEQLTRPTCSKVFEVIKTMCKHMASHKGPFHCRVKGCSAGLFLLPKCLNRHMEGKHRFSQGGSSGNTY